jgi:hypothetical protein
MPAPSSGRDSRRGSKASGEAGLHNVDRKEKAKSTQVNAPTRPQTGTRTNSAPLVERRRGSGYAAGLQRIPPSQENAAQAGTGAAKTGQDEDEVAGAVGTVRQYEPFQSPQVCKSRGSPAEVLLWKYKLTIYTARRTHA